MRQLEIKVELKSKEVVSVEIKKDSNDVIFVNFEDTYIETTPEELKALAVIGDDLLKGDE